MNAIPVLTIDDVATLDGVLADFLKKAEAELTVVIDRGGNVISQYGDMAVMDVTIIAALAAGSFAATREFGAAHRRDRIQCPVSPGERQPYFHELGRRRNDHDHGFRTAHDCRSRPFLLDWDRPTGCPLAESAPENQSRFYFRSLGHFSRADFCGPGCSADGVELITRVEFFATSPPLSGC